MKVSDNTAISMPMRNLISIVITVAIGVWGYFGIVERVTRLETSDQLMSSDLLKKAALDKNIHTQIKLDHLEEQLTKALNDIEKIKDKVRKNGNSH